MQEEAIATPCQWLLVEVTAVERLLTVSAVHETLVRSLVARATPFESQPLLRQERAEEDAQIAQSLIDHPVCVFSVSRSNLYGLARLSRFAIHCLVLPCCVVLQCCLVLLLSRLPIHR